MDLTVSQGSAVLREQQRRVFFFPRTLLSVSEVLSAWMQTPFMLWESSQGRATATPVMHWLMDLLHCIIL